MAKQNGIVVRRDLAPGVDLFLDPALLMYDVSVDAINLTQGMSEQTGNVVYYGELNARAEAQVAYYKQAVEILEAQLIKDMRSVYAAKGDTKVSEVRLEKEVRLNPKMIEMQQRLRDAKYVHSLHLSVMDAFDHRRSMLIQSAKTAIQSGYGDPSVRGVNSN